MQTVLSRVKTSDVRLDPFPHLVIHNAIESKLADQLLEEFPSIETITKGVQYGSNQRFSLGAADVERSPVIRPIWKEFVAGHVTQAFSDHISELFQIVKRRAGIRNNNDFSEAEILLDAQICINTPVTQRPTTVKGAHIDNEREVYAGLWYLRPDNDTSTGADLDIYRSKVTKPKFHGARLVASRFVKKVTTIRYEHNTLVLFLNSSKSLHGVTPRMPTSNLRYLFNIIGEVRDPLFDISKQRENVIDKIMRHVWD